ncbi:hypothetical protein FB567DRAFT_611021, partial [Paraphoma chrysanthemicola]
PLVNLVFHYVGKYVDHIIAKSVHIREKIDSVEQMVRGPRNDTLSRLLSQLSEYKYDIRSSKLDQQVAFSGEAVEWANQILKRAPGYADLAYSLLDKTQGGYESSPDRLRERIDDLRVFIADLATEEKQEEDERLQLRAQERGEWRQHKVMLRTRGQDHATLGMAIVTMAFLPATFVSSFFGMNFFNGIAGPVPFDEASRHVWIFFVIALPMSATVAVVFFGW